MNPIESSAQPAHNLAAAFEQLADHSAEQGYYGLQDANLLLAEAVRECRSGLQADLSAMLTDWSALITHFPKAPEQTVNDIIRYLRRPEIELPLASDEFDTLEQQLRSEAGELAGKLGDNEAIAADSAHGYTDHSSIAQAIETIVQLADQAAAQDLFGLQDAHLLLAEALRAAGENPAVNVADISALSAQWTETAHLYQKSPDAGVKAIIEFLRNPSLNIAMDDDEWSMLNDQLSAERTTETLYLDSGIASGPAPCSAETADTALAPPSNPVSAMARELAELLLLQTAQVRSHLQTIAGADTVSVGDGLQQAIDALERFANAADSAGFEGLGSMGRHVNENLKHFSALSDGFTARRQNLVCHWLQRVEDYLQSFDDNSAGDLLVMALAGDEWALLLSPEELTALHLQVRAQFQAVTQCVDVARITTADDEHISLALPEDVNPELLELLLQELPVHTRQFSDAVHHLQSAGSETDLETAQRIAHTLKGSANTVGIRGIAELTHHLEDILTACAREHKVPAGALAQSLIDAADCLESMSEALINCGPPPADAKAVLQEILDWANRIDCEGLPDFEAKDPITGLRPALHDSAAADVQPAQESVRTAVRVPAEHVDSLFRLSGESIILNSQAQETARRMKSQLHNMQIQFELLQQLGAELEQLIDLKDFSGHSAGTGGLDALEMDQYNELHTASRRMAEAAIDAREMSLDIDKDLDNMSALLDIQQRSVIDAQEVVMQTRLVSIATIVPRLQRSFRQTCRMTGKHGELLLLGENIMIDGDTLNALVDPLMHLLRNAVDHGIESEDERSAHGKPAHGQVTFEFDREGNHILVRCRDDGRGLDYGAIRAAAEKRGMLQPGQAVGEEELKNLILQPNFSSRTVSSQTSGRGVGMDVVRAQIVNMGGTLALDSIPGRGLTVELRVPLPLSMTYALLTHAGRYPVAIANKGIRQILHASMGQITTHDSREILLLDGQSYPLVRLTELLHVADQRSESERSYSAILLADNGDDTTAVLIDAIAASQEVVIKSMGHYLGKVPGYIGATILGDGTVTPVLDIPELLRLPSGASFNVSAETTTVIESASLLPTVLVVDDSLSQRRALEQLLADAGYRVRLARDGIEAAEFLAHTRPDAVLTDLEMPRMNGIELTAHIRSQQKLASLPVLMITSRTTQKHRQMAENAGIDAYFSKPVRDDNLLIQLHQLMEQAFAQTRASA